MTSSAEGETKGDFWWDVWVGGGDFKLLLLNPEFLISPFVRILAFLRLKKGMALSELEELVGGGGRRMCQQGKCLLWWCIYLTRSRTADADAEEMDCWKILSLVDLGRSFG